MRKWKKKWNEKYRVKIERDIRVRKQFEIGKLVEMLLELGVPKWGKSEETFRQVSFEFVIACLEIITKNASVNFQMTDFPHSNKYIQILSFPNAISKWNDGSNFLIHRQSYVGFECIIQNLSNFDYINKQEEFGTTKLVACYWALL